MPAPPTPQELPPPSLHVQFLTEMDRLEQLQRELLARVDWLEEQERGPWIELYGIEGSRGVYRMEDILTMHRGLCKLFGAAYLKEWTAEERRWQRASERREKARENLRAAIQLVYFDRVHSHQKEPANEAREVAGWDSPSSPETRHR